MKTKLLLLTAFMAVTISVNAQFWTVQNTGFANASRGINNISIVDSNVVWAKAYDGSGSGATVLEFTKTTDGGATWTPGTFNLGVNNVGIAMIHAVSQDIAWTVAYPNSNSATGGIYKTTDGGTNWVRQSTASYNSSGSFPNVVYFWDENTGFCQGDPTSGYFEIYTTNDGGTNWSRVPQANIPAPLAGEYGYVGQVFVTGNTLWFTTNKGRIFKSTDFGHNFVAYQTPISDFGSASSSGEISFWDDNNGLLINQLGSLWGTSDGGATWNSIFPNSGVVFGGDIFCIPGTNTAISTGSSSSLSGSSYTLDGGQNWVTIDSDQHLDVQFLDNTTGWSGGFNADATTGGIFKYSGNVLNIADNGNLEAFSVYPNPVNDVLNINGTDVISKVLVYNVFGQKVIELSPNTNTLSIDTSNFVSGAYFVQLSSDDKTKTIKILK